MSSLKEPSDEPNVGPSTPSKKTSGPAAVQKTVQFVHLQESSQTPRDIAVGDSSPESNPRVNIPIVLQL